MNCGGLLDLNRTLAAEYLSKFTYPWEALDGLGGFIEDLGNRLDKREYVKLNGSVWAHVTARISSAAYVGAPCIIGENAEVRHCAFIRGSALIGKNCVVGNSTELKNVILFDGVQLPHFNYAGDSILGFKAHLGAGAIISNVKSDKSRVAVTYGGIRRETGMKKFGAVIGDYAEIGCNSVLNPGTVVGADTVIYPLSCVRGEVPPHCIYKTGGAIALKRFKR